MLWCCGSRFVIPRGQRTQARLPLIMRCRKSLDTTTENRVCAYSRQLPRFIEKVKEPVPLPRCPTVSWRPVDFCGPVLRWPRRAPYGPRMDPVPHGKPHLRRHSEDASCVRPSRDPVHRPGPLDQSAENGPGCGIWRGRDRPDHRCRPKGTDTPGNRERPQHSDACSHPRRLILRSGAMTNACSLSRPCRRASAPSIACPPFWPWAPNWHRALASSPRWKGPPGQLVGGSGSELYHTVQSMESGGVRVPGQPRGGKTMKALRQRNAASAPVTRSLPRRLVNAAAGRGRQATALERSLDAATAVLTAEDASAEQTSILHESDFLRETLRRSR